jgi:uncharacterized protein (TIGR00304 family)
MRRQLGATLIALGLMLVFLFFIQAAMQGNASFGGVVLIGPIPIVFGSSPQMALASMLLAIILMALSFLLLIRPGRNTDKEACMRCERRPKEEQQGEESSAQIKGGAVVMIGPIPLVVGSDSRTALLMMLIALAIIGIWALAILQ